MYIHQLKVKNFRSLKDISVGNLSPMVTLYGNNNTGKSNILSFLEILFKQKYVEEITEAAGESRFQRRPVGFWQGEIEDFSDNYFQNSKEPIEFSVIVRFDRSEIRGISGIPTVFLNKLNKRRQHDLMKLDGQITSSEAGRARFALLQAQFDQKSFYDTNLPDTGRYLNGFKLKAADAQRAFDGVMSKLNDGFLMIPATRYLKREQEKSRSEVVELNSDAFKNWLFQSSINRETESTFRQISQQFGSAPFDFGKISIARVGEDGIEVFIEGPQGNFKLPIGRKGSGVQQILIILAYIASSKSPMIGIEELEINLSPAAQNLIFNSLHHLAYTAASPVKQIFLTTHSPYIGRRNEAERRGVWMEGGETKIEKPTNAKIDNFFVSPLGI